jgi:hypothetical protein
MHLLEKYALDTGAKIDKPYIYEQYFPMPECKYIVFHSEGAGSKNYTHWQEAINVLLPILEKEGIKIFNIGKDEEHVPKKKYGGVVDIKNGTSIANVSYIIKNCILYLGVDCFSAQLAGMHDKKSVVIYSHVFKENRNPYFGDKEKQILIEPDRKGRKPWLNEQDTEGDADNICPYEIASAVCKLLGLEYKRNFKSIFKGDWSSRDIIDLVPNKSISEYGLGCPLIRIRMDIENNQHNMIKTVAEAPEKVSIMLDASKPIDLGPLMQFKEKISEIIFFCDEKCLNVLSDDSIRKISSFPARVHFTTLENKEVQNKIKMKFLDSIYLNPMEPITKEDVIGDADIKSLFYTSSQRILSNGKIYPSYHAFKQDKPVNTLSKIALPLVDAPEVWESERFITILEKNIDN